jgi:hypothetical protein
MMSACLWLLGDMAMAQPSEREDTARQSEVERAAATKEELFRERRELLVEGTNVYLEDMVVRAKSGVMTRVAYGKHEIFVAPIDPSELQFVAIGARVDVRGTLREAPTAPQARLAYAMSPREARRLARHRIYVRAWSLTTR